MFKSKTVFVIGAGASKDLGLPLGAELKSRIADAVDFEVDEFSRLESGDRAVYEAIRVAGPHRRTIAERWVRAAKSIKNGMPLAISIDNFIDARSSNDVIADVGKFAIISEILKAERASSLYVGEKFHRDAGLNNVPDSWLVNLFWHLTEGVKRESLWDLFANVSFVIFNYDRCVEEFLFQALIRYYEIQPEEAAAALNKAVFIHPYGVVGRLRWQQDDRSAAYFGEALGGEHLVENSKSIVTFAESRASERRSDIAGVFSKATSVCFIGFAFLEQNMQLLGTPAPNLRRVYATALGFSDSDAEVIRSRIINAFLPENGVSMNLGSVKVRPDLDAKRFMEAYSLSLTQ